MVTACIENPRFSITRILNLILLNCCQRHFPADSLVAITIYPEESEDGIMMLQNKY